VQFFSGQDIPKIVAFLFGQNLKKMHL